MSKNISNSYHPSATYVGVNSLVRTNQWAEDENAVKLYGIETLTTRHSVGFTWAVTTAGDQVAFTPTTNPTSAADYYKFRLNDESGNEAYGNFVSSAPTNAINVNTSSLNPEDDWRVEFATSSGSGASVTRFSFDIVSAAIYANSSGSVSYTI
mgnify:CR=1 FL=1